MSAPLKIPENGLVSFLGNIAKSCEDKIVPHYQITQADGAEVDRLDLGLTTVREHCRRAEQYTSLMHDWLCDDYGNIRAAVTVIETGRIDR